MRAQLNLPESMLRPRVWGHCRWCDKPVLNDDASINHRRLWHASCAETYRLMTRPRALRAALRKRDKKICAICGQKCNSTDRPWEADHIVPLFLSEGRHYWFGLGNAQTLCRADHLKKTQTDMENYRRHRRGEPIVVLQGEESDLILIGSHLKIVYHEGSEEFPERLLRDLERFQPYLKNAE